LIKIARISVPSITAPHLIARPIPRPRKNHPNTDIRRVSLVITGICTNCTKSARVHIPKILFIPKFFPIVRNARNIKGAFMIISSIERGIVVSSFTISETPVTHPSMKEFGRRNDSSQNAAENAPRAIRRLP
jgi:hypothetical protein